MLYKTAIGLGGNIGETRHYFEKAIHAFKAHHAVQHITASHIYRTKPWGKLDQPSFLNMVVVFETSLKPHTLLHLCLDIERTCGRERREKWGPRTLDLDILVFDHIELNDDDLVLPHPCLMERPFVVIPLATIWPDLVVKGQILRNQARLFSATDLEDLGPFHLFEI